MNYGFVIRSLVECTLGAADEVVVGDLHQLSAVSVLPLDLCGEPSDGNGIYVVGVGVYADRKSFSNEIRN